MRSFLNVRLRFTQLPYEYEDFASEHDAEARWAIRQITAIGNFCRTEYFESHVNGLHHKLRSTQGKGSVLSKPPRSHGCPFLSIVHAMPAPPAGTESKIKRFGLCETDNSVD
jgi:hypothetical protein